MSIVGWALAAVQVVAGLFGLLLISGTVLSMTRLPQAWVRMWDFPRSQIAVLAPVTAAVYFGVAWRGGYAWYDWLLLALLLLVTVWQAWCVLPWLPSGRVEVLSAADAGRGDAGDGVSFRIVVSNVLLENQEYDRWARVILREDPDLIVAAETDELWIDAIAERMGDRYPHRMLQPQDNCYGLSLWSRLPLSNQSTEFIVQKDIPSFHTDIRLPDGREVRLHALHPRPPAPQEGDSSSPRDAELIVVGRRIADRRKKQADAEAPLPTIVVGDLNDVAWSRTTRLFQKTSRLLDPRRGRGFYNSFSANSRIMRFPLDHVFVSKDFALDDLRVLDFVGSDHFPVCITLHIDPQADAAHETPKETADDRQETEEILRQEQERETNGDEDGHLHRSSDAVTHPQETPGGHPQEKR